MIGMAVVGRLPAQNQTAPETTSIKNGQTTTKRLNKLHARVYQFVCSSFSTRAGL